MTESKFTAEVSIVTVVVSIGLEVAPTTQKNPSRSLITAVAMSSLELPNRRFQINFLLLSKVEIKPSLPPKVGEVTRSINPVSTVPTTANKFELSARSEIWSPEPAGETAVIAGFEGRTLIAAEAVGEIMDKEITRVKTQNLTALLGKFL